MTTRFMTVLAALLAASLLSAGTAAARPAHMQDQPLRSAKCGQYAMSNAINWMTGASTTGEQIYRKKKFRWYRDPNGASYHTGKRDLVKAVARAYYLNVEKFEGARLHRGFKAARKAVPDGGTIILLAKGDGLTGGGHFVMGYLYKKRGDKFTVSDSNRKNPDKAYSVSWLLNPAKGYVVKLWVLT